MKKILSSLPTLLAVGQVMNLANQLARSYRMLHRKHLEYFDMSHEYYPLFL